MKKCITASVLPSSLASMPGSSAIIASDSIWVGVGDKGRGDEGVKDGRGGRHCPAALSPLPPHILTHPHTCGPLSSAPGPGQPDSSIGRTQCAKLRMPAASVVVAVELSSADLEGGGGGAAGEGLRV